MRPEKHLYEFGSFRLDPAERRLLRGGQPVQLEPKAFDVLVLLVENGGHLLGKEELMNKVWPEAFVEEGSLTKSISNLRKALVEGQAHADVVQFIETVPKRGYRFAAGVRKVTGEDDVLGVGEHTRARIITKEEESGTGAKEKPHELEMEKSTSWWLRPAVLAGGLMLIGVVVVIFNLPTEKSKSPTQIGSVAVLPFKSLNPEAGDEYLGLGMADTLITKLSGIKHLVVRPTSAVRSYVDGERDPLAAGREQRVDAVLDGSIQKSAGKIRVTARLVNVRDGVSLWAGTFDENFTDMFAVQNLISERVAGALARELTGDEIDLLNKRYTDSKEAYQLYLMGRYFWNKRTKEGTQKGITFFQQAVEADPQYALAYAGLADSHIIIATFFSSTDPAEEWLKAKEAALKALEIDETLCEAHASLAFVRYWYEWDWAGSEAEYRRAIELNPNYATAHHWYSLLLASTGRLDPAVAEIEQAQELDPSSLMINQIHGWVLYLARRNDEAIEQLQKTIEMDPNFGAHYPLAQAYLEKRMPDQAIAAFLKDEPDPQKASALKKAYEASGLKGFWRKQLELLREEADRRYIPPSFFADIYARLGEKDQALTWLDKAYATHDGWLVFLKVHPKYDSLRSDPRFAELLRRVGLPQ